MAARFYDVYDDQGLLVDDDVMAPSAEAALVQVAVDLELKTVPSDWTAVESGHADEARQEGF